MSIRICIADDHGIVRQGLRMYLQFDPELEIVGEAANGREALEMVGRLLPDVVLMDILMPVMDGLEATAAIRKSFPDTEVIALTSVLDEPVIHQAIRAGAIGYLLKDTGSDELCRAIHAVVAGEVHLSRQAVMRMAMEHGDINSLQSLTERETEVLCQIALGHSNKEIAQTLFIAEKTVKAHVSSVLSKLGVSSRTQAALVAIRFGLVKAEETPE